jgi:hypothetical protein
VRPRRGCCAADEAGGDRVVAEQRPDTSSTGPPQPDVTITVDPACLLPWRSIGEVIRAVMQRMLPDD